MKYFCIYRPVEGDIREGDTTIWHIAINRPIGFYVGKQHIEFLMKNGYKAAKFFLCSRDITFGRGIYCGNRETEYGSMSRNRFDGKINLYKADDPNEVHVFSPLEVQCYKLIGEISPHCTWVREGMEFHEDQVSIPSTTKRLSGMGYTISIKCPHCGTFK